MTVALSLSRWYFCKTKSSSTSSHTVVQALGTTCRYHLGTAAFGSFVIAVVSMVRTTLLYIKKKFSYVILEACWSDRGCAHLPERCDAAQGQNDHACKGGAAYYGMLPVVLRQVLAILEQKRLHPDSNLRLLLLQGVSQGSCACAVVVVLAPTLRSSFLFLSRMSRPCLQAFFLIARNILRVGAVMLVGDFVMFVGKMCVTVLCGGVACKCISLTRSFNDSFH